MRCDAGHAMPCNAHRPMSGIGCSARRTRRSAREPHPSGPHAPNTTKPTHTNATFRRPQGPSRPTRPTAGPPRTAFRNTPSIPQHTPRFDPPRVDFRQCRLDPATTGLQDAIATPEAAPPPGLWL